MTKKCCDDVVGAQVRALHALPAAPLRPVQVGLGALGVAGAGDRDDDVFLGDEVFHRDVAVVRDQPGAALVAVLVDDLGELVADDRALPAGLGEDVVEVRDLALDLGRLVDDPLPLEGGQPAQLQVEDGDGLHLVDLEQLHQPGCGPRPRTASCGSARSRRRAGRAP